MVIKINNLYKNYENLLIFKNFNISFRENCVSSILGPSGCGKTTLLNIISNLEKYDSGKIQGLKNKRSSYVFQEPRLLDWFNVYENIEFVIKDKFDKNIRHSLIKEYLDIVGLWEYKDYYPNNLSGGMKQRVSIARAFIFPSDILLMDEPFKGLDIKTKHNLINKFIEIWEKDKRTVIYVTHEINEALLVSDMIYQFSSKPTNIINKIEIKEKRINRDLEDKNFIKYKRVFNNF